MTGEKQKAGEVGTTAAPLVETVSISLCTLGSRPLHLPTNRRFGGAHGWSEILVGPEPCSEGKGRLQLSNA